MIFGHFYAQNGGFKAAKSNLLGWRIVNATARLSEHPGYIIKG